MNYTILASKTTGSATIITPQGVRSIDEIDNLTEFFYGTGAYPVLEVESLVFPLGEDPRRIGENIIVRGLYRGRSFVVGRVNEGYFYGRRKILHLIVEGRVVIINKGDAEEVVISEGKRMN